MLVVKNPPTNAGDTGLIHGLGRSPGEGNGSPLQYSWLENSIQRSLVGVAKSWKRLKLLNTFTQQLCWSPGVQQGEVLKLLVWGIGCPACGQPDFVSYLHSGEVIWLVLLRPQPVCNRARVQRWKSSCGWGGGVKLQKCGHLNCPQTVNGIVSSERGHEWEHTLWGNRLAWFNVPSIIQWSLKTKDVYDLPKAEKIRMLNISNCKGSVNSQLQV